MPSSLGTFNRVTPSLRRRVAMEVYDAMPPGHMMFGLVDVDVTDATAWVQAQRDDGVRVSLVAVWLRALAVALAEHPELNAIRDGNQVVVFDDVDVNLPVERHTAEGDFPHSVVVRRAQDKSAVDIYGDIEAARHDGNVDDDARVWRGMRLLMALPKPLRRWVLRRLASNAMRIKDMAGTTFVTSVSKFGTASGFVLPLAAGPRAVSIALGPVVDKPVVRDGDIAVRTVMGVTLMMNHDLVDGAPAARFATRLQELIETGPFA